MKKIISVLIVMIMAVSLNGFAYTPYISDSEVKVQSIRFVDMITMEEVSSVAPGQMLEVTVDVKAGTNIAPAVSSTVSAKASHS